MLQRLSCHSVHRAQLLGRVHEASPVARPHRYVPRTPWYKALPVSAHWLHQVLYHQPEADRTHEDARWYVLSPVHSSNPGLASRRTEKRYTCVHQACLPAEGTDPKYYPTWSALQHHTRTAHPPTCPHPSCNGKTFTQQKGLRAHLKIHAQRDKEAELDDAGAISGDDEGEDSRPRKRRRGGEVGRDWVCDVEGCTKDFKSVRPSPLQYTLCVLY